VRWSPCSGEPRPGGDGTRTRTLLDALRPWIGLGAAIESFWLDPTHRAAPTWIAHRDTGDVMLATCLVPDGYLQLLPVPARRRAAAS
jgi:hypothetical protein